jgi:hypothetical protein
VIEPTLAYDCLDFLVNNENTKITENKNDDQEFTHPNKKIKLDDVISKENDNLKTDQNNKAEKEVEKKPEKNDDNSDKMIDSLNCSICSEIMHECIRYYQKVLQFIKSFYILVLKNTVYSHACILTVQDAIRNGW